LNVNTTGDDGGWQHRKPYQSSFSSAVSRERLDHHDNQQAQPPQQRQERNRAMHTVWQSASVAAEDAINNRKSKELQRNGSGEIIHFTVLVQ